jgi:hypothetical protein
MYSTLFLSVFALASCLGNPAHDAPSSSSASTAQSATAPKDLFPAAKEGISVKAGSDGDMKLAALLNEFSRVTGNTLLITKDTRVALENVSTGLNRNLEIPAPEVYPVVESILAHNDFVLLVYSEREPRLIAVENLNANRRGGLKEAALFVPVDQIAQWSRHSAFLVTTVVDLKYTDVRTLSNSLRTMFTDQNTQQIIPVGNSDTLLITGHAPFVAGLVTTLRAIDDSARASAEAAKKAQPSPAAKPKEAPSKETEPQPK